MRTARASASDDAGRALLGRALATRRRDLVAATVLYSGHQIGEALVPVIVGGVVGRAIARGDATRIGYWLALLAADFVFLSLCYRLGARASMRAKQGSGHEVRLWLTDRVVAPGGGIGSAPGELLSRAGSDATRIGAFAGMVAFTISRAVVVVVATVALILLSPLFALVVVGGTLVLTIVQPRIAAVLQRRAVGEQHRVADATATAEDLLRGMRVLRGIGAQRVASERYARTSRASLAAALHSVRAESALTAAATAISGAYLLVVVGVGGWLALSGRLGLGGLVSALGLAQFIAGPMRVVAGISAFYARARASAARIADTLAEPAAVSLGGDAPTPAGPLGVRLDAVPAGPATVSFDARGGQLTGIVVDEAAVADAIVDLLARGHDPASGAVLVGGVPADRWPLAELRRAVVVAPHDAALFDGTVADNVTAQAGGGALIEAAMHASFADQVVDTLPQGAATPVGERGLALSGGQRQRVALARALAADPPVLVLHDPTTSVDAVTEDLIAGRLRDARRGRTTLLLTSSPALLARCDRVVHLALHPAYGNTATGSHAELIAADEGYRERMAR